MGEQKKRGKRPRPIDYEEVHQKLAEGSTMTEVANSQGRKKTQQFVDLAKKDAELKAAIELGREETKRKSEQRIIPAAQNALINLVLDPSHTGHTAAVIFVHKAMLGYRESQRHEVSGEVNHVHSLSPEQRLEKIKALQAELTEAVDVQLIPEGSDDSK